MCFHLTEHDWDPKLCAAIGVPADIWPEVRPSVGTFAHTHEVPGVPDGIPITGVLGDQQSALMGQACVNEGMAKCTYGTGAFLLLNTGSRATKSRHRLLTTVAWALGKNDYTYALEGSAFLAGAAVQWLRDGLKIIKKSKDVEKLAKSVKSSEGVTFVPALTGLGAPHWEAEATGMITGITRGTNKGHIARATLEGIAFQNADILTAMQKDLGKPITRLNVDGGAAANDLLLQFQSDVLGIELVRPEFIETTSLGAVFAAGLGIGMWKDLSEIEKTWKEQRTFKPTFSEKDREKALKHWHEAVERVRPQHKK
jgi:glycerol kinase